MDKERQKEIWRKNMTQERERAIRKQKQASADVVAKARQGRHVALCHYITSELSTVTT